MREAAGGSPATIQVAVDAFSADLGQPNQGRVPGPQTGGRREVTRTPVERAVSHLSHARTTANRQTFRRPVPRGLLGAGDHVLAVERT